MEDNHELVPQETAEVIPAKKIQVRGHVFQPVIIGGAHEGELHHFSQREFRFLDKFLETRNLPAACQEIGVAENTGRNYLKRPNIRRYLDEKARIAAIAAGTDVTELMSWLKAVRDGKPASTGQIEAAKVLAKMLRPAGSGAGVQVNIQNNVNGGPSPYANMSTEQIAAAMRERADAFGEAA